MKNKVLSILVAFMVAFNGVAFSDIFPGEYIYAEDVTVEDSGDYYTGTDVETVLQEIGAGSVLSHGDMTDMPDAGGTNSDHDARYYTKTEIGSTTLGSSGSELVGLPSLDATNATVRTFVDGVSSSLYYTGGLITENSALDGTIDISEISGAIKLTTTGLTMASFTISAATGTAVVSGNNWICADLNTDTPIFTVVQANPNHSTVFPIGRVYKDAESHLHIAQGGHEFTDFPELRER